MTRTVSCALLFACATLACSPEETGQPGGTGGTTSTGGTVTGSGGATGGSSTGGLSTGGTTANTGGRNTGGIATGGQSSSGGRNTGGSATGGSSTGTCPSPVLKSGNSTKTITAGGLSREYILHVPSAYTGTTPVPLVVDFHPIGGSDTQWSSGSPYPAVIDKEGVISAFPNGEPSPNMGNAWNVQGCCVSKINGADVDDIAFAKALVADVEKVACIDAKRVYAVGFSMGGGMSHYVACHAADVFAAVGPAAFDLTQQNEPGCTPARPITVVSWRGTSDNVVPYAGGHSALVTGMAIDFLGAAGTFQKWASKDGCTGNPSAADSNNCQTYSQCSAGVQVTLCTAQGGGHAAANASVVWPMLKKYTLP
jgi:polyhydroxybutyrate depolymerase